MNGYEANNAINIIPNSCNDSILTPRICAYIAIIVTPKSLNTFDNDVNASANNTSLNEMLDPLDIEITNLNNLLDEFLNSYPGI